MQDRHKRAAKALGYALTLADPQKWAATAIIWEARLVPAERYELARSILLAMPFEDSEAVFADVMGGAGYPLPTFLDPLDEAQWWADLAKPIAQHIDIPNTPRFPAADESDWARVMGFPMRQTDRAALAENPVPSATRVILPLGQLIATWAYRAASVLKD